MFEVLERRSLLEKKYMLHPYIPYVYIHGKQYFCKEHLELERLNRGSMRQHIQGKKHKLDFDTGKPLVKTKSPLPNVEHIKSENQKSSKKESFNKDPFWDLALKLVIMVQNPAIGSILAKHRLEGELRDDVMFLLQLIAYDNYLKEINKQNSTK